MLPVKPDLAYRSFIAILTVSLTASGCATTAPGKTATPPEFSNDQASQLLRTETDFIDHVAGKELSLLHESIAASLTFDPNGTASGTLIRAEGDRLPMQLNWAWEGEVYCRTGSIGNTATPKKCESVTLYPDVGILLEYVDTDDPDEYWVFSQ